MARRLAQGQTVELRGGTLRATPECPVSGSLKGAKAVVVREPRRCAGPSGKIEDRVVVKPILGNGATGFPIELSADHVSDSNAFLPKFVDRVKGAFRRRPAATAAPKGVSAPRSRGIVSRAYSQAGRDNWDRIFGSKRRARS